MPIEFRGDITIDNYEFYGEFETASASNGKSDKAVTSASSSPTEPSQDPEGQNRHKTIARQFGGAYLLARFTTVAWSIWYGANDMRSWMMGDLKPWSTTRDWWNDRLNELFWNPRDFDHHWQVSYRLIKCEKEYRIQDDGHEGFTPPLGRDVWPDTDPIPAPAIGNGPVKLFVINDRADSTYGNKKLADEIAAASDSWTVIKEVGPPAKKAEDRLLAGLLAVRPDKVVGVFSGDDLRSWGVPISRSLSWERTVRDVVEATRRGDLLRGHTPPHLVITFDYDAALYLHTKPVSNNSNRRIVHEGLLVFSIGGAEGDFTSNISGDMPGAQTAFVSVFSTLLYRQLEQKALSGKPGEFPLTHADRILATALVAKRRVLESGFAINDTGRPFREEVTRSGDNERRVPRLYYSEGIFSLHSNQPRFDRPQSEAPDPFLAAEKGLNKRDFRDPFDDEAFAWNLSEQKLDCYRFQRSQLLNPTRNIRSIFNDAAGPRERLADFAERAVDYVITGKAPKQVPICSFGKIKTAEVEEIEHFRTIRQLVRAYLSNTAANRPLGIAVFGPPGAGKGFSVDNIMEMLPAHLKNLVKEDRHKCNLTALSEPEDLVHYFQLARNSALRGKVPMLFFDEFDCTAGETKFFWLKHFLGPLQDGEFLENHIIHPIGKAIFIFAGGVCRTFAAFAKEMNKNSDQVREQLKRKDADAQQVTNFKGVDFLSRLHGYIDIAAFSPEDAEWEETKSAELRKKLNQFYHPHYRDKHAILINPSYLMRRAFTLRSMLEYHLDKIFSKQPRREARIDRKIVRAMLATKIFLHGARSMEAIIRMSVLEDSDSFKIAHLPPDKQLKMHVDSENFSNCLNQDVAMLWSEAADQPSRPARRQPRRRRQRRTRASSGG